MQFSLAMNLQWYQVHQADDISRRERLPGICFLRCSISSPNAKCKYADVVLLTHQHELKRTWEQYAIQKRKQCKGKYEFSSDGMMIGLIHSINRKRRECILKVRPLSHTHRVLILNCTFSVTVFCQGE